MPSGGSMPGLQFWKDTRPVLADGPIGRIVEEGIVVFRLHILAFDKLERAVGIKAVSGEFGHDIAAMAGWRPGC